MKKNVLIVISIIVGCLLILLTFQHFRPQLIWRTISNQYINRFSNKLGYRISAHAFASHSENLTPDMSYKTISDSLVFQADEDFNGEPGKGESPLPYPPIEVYCVVAHSSMDQTEFFLIAMHTDGQNSAWVVHDLRVNGKMFRTLIERIGCDITSW